MDQILLEYDRKAMWDTNEEINFIVRIANLTEDTISYSDVEAAAKLVSYILKNLYGNNCNCYESMLQKNDQEKYIRIYNYKIFTANPWLFQVILLYSLKNLDITSFDNNENSRLLQVSIKYIKKYLNIFKKHSVFLLKSLEFILLKQNILPSSLSWELLHYMNIVALSPIMSCRHYANNISKSAIFFLTTDKKQLLCTVDLIPIKGIETIDVLKLFSEDCIRLNKEKIIKRLFKLFKNNTEKKDAALLYEKLLLFYSFDEWQEDVWPLFIDHLKEIEFDGEFFQSLIKYWISLNINAYKGEFYAFLKNRPFDFRLKAYILLESRKRGFILESQNHLMKIFYDIETVKLGLKIVSTYYKKSMCPKLYEIEIVLDFLYSFINSSLDDECVRSLKLFFSQLIFYAHNNLEKCKEQFEYYLEFVNKVCDYCYVTLNTELFEVGAQVLHILLDTLMGPQTNLYLIYKVEKKEFYDAGDNLLYKELKAKNLWRFYEEKMILRLKYCFTKKQGSSKILVDLITKYYFNEKFIDIKVMKSLLRNIENFSTLRNMETILNCSELLYKNENNDELKIFTANISENFIKNLGTFENMYCEEHIFKYILYITILAVAEKNNFEIEHFPVLINKLLLSVSRIVNSYITYETHYNFTKIIETFINNVVLCLVQNLDSLWTSVDKKFIIIHVIEIIQKSNMKKSVSLSVEALKQIGKKMEDQEEDRKLKIKILDGTMKQLYKAPAKQSNKIRRNPETRLIIHAFCSYEKILIKNADLQLVKALVGRLYGVSLRLYNRHKNIEDLFMLFPQLTIYFFKIISSEKLDERSIIVFQFFLESQVRDHIFQHDISKTLEYFQYSFVKIIKNHPNQFGKLAVLSYVALCKTSNILEMFYDITEYMKTNYNSIQKNIFSNFAFLLQELYDKYQHSFEHDMNPRKLLQINFYLKDLIMFLRHFDIKVFDFLLLKVKSFEDIFPDIPQLDCEHIFEDRLWLNNNLPFLFINAKPCNFHAILNNILSNNKIPEFMQVKILSILVSRFENGEFNNENVQNIINILYKISILLDSHSNYLLNCYFKVILLLSQNCNNPVITLDITPKITSNLYKTMILILYSAMKGLRYENNHLKDFFKSAETQYQKSISISEEKDNDIISTLIYFREIAADNYSITLCKLVFYYSLYHSTYLEAYYSISVLTNKKYCSIFVALKEFLLEKNLKKLLGCEHKINKFFQDINMFIDKSYSEGEKYNGFYEIESDNLVPVDILRKLLLYKYCTKFSESSVNKCLEN